MGRIRPCRTLPPSVNRPRHLPDGLRIVRRRSRSQATNDDTGCRFHPARRLPTAVVPHTVQRRGPMNRTHHRTRYPQASPTALPDKRPWRTQRRVCLDVNSLYSSAAPWLLTVAVIGFSASELRTLGQLRQRLVASCQYQYGTKPITVELWAGRSACWTQLPQAL